MPDPGRRAPLAPCLPRLLPHLLPRNQRSPRQPSRLPLAPCAGSQHCLRGEEGRSSRISLLVCVPWHVKIYRHRHLLAALDHPGFPLGHRPPVGRQREPGLPLGPGPGPKKPKVVQGTRGRRLLYERGRRVFDPKRGRRLLYERGRRVVLIIIIALILITCFPVEHPGILYGGPTPISIHMLSSLPMPASNSRTMHPAASTNRVPSGLTSTCKDTTTPRIRRHQRNHRQRQRRHPLPPVVVDADFVILAPSSLSSSLPTSSSS